MAIDVELKAPKQGNVTWPSTFLTSNRFPIVANRVFATLADAQAYVNDTAIDASAYPGIILAVIRDVEDKNGVYYVKSIPTKEGETGELVKVGTNSGTPISSVDTYVLEHSIFDLDSLASGRITELAVNIAKLMQAVTDNKIVIAKYYKKHNITSIPCICYCEDPNDAFYIEILLEKKIITIIIDLTDLEGDVVTIYTKDITITELQEKLESGKNIKTINGQSILGRGNLEIEGLPSVIPDWNENNPSAVSYIKNRTHYLAEHKITEEFTLVGFLYNKCKYDEDTDGYYTTADIKIRYNEDDYEGTIIIQKGTLLGYDNFNDEVTITGEDQGEEFAFISYVEDYNIYFKVSQPNYGTNFRLLEYVTLDEAYIPDTIARKSDLENIGGGGSVDSEEITKIKTTLESHEELIEDLQNMKIDKENDDYYPNMSVGVADNLSGVDVVASEFTSRQSGGGAILDGTARIEAIKGNSIVWNQLSEAPVFNPNASSGWAVSNYNAGVGVSVENNEIRLDFKAGFASGGSFYISPRVPLKKEHKYLYSFFIKKNTTVDCGVYLGGIWQNFGRVVADTWYEFDYIATPIDSLNRGLWLYPLNGLGSTALEYDITAWVKNVVVYDLTQMFGAGNEPTTIEDFNKRIPVGVDSMLYNEGQMINLKPSGIKSYSADEEPIKRFQDLSLIAASFPDGMKSVGEFHDEIRYNKETQKWEKITRIGEVDLGSLNWSYASDVGYFYSRPSEDIGGGNTFKNTDKQVALINSEDFTGLHWSAFTNNYVDPRNNAISLFYTPDWDAVRANILCNGYTDAASFKEYLQGKKAYFVLNDPIVEEIDFDGNLDYQVWNGGTEEVVPYDEPTTPLKADIAYGFNAVGKIKELEEKINSGGGGGVSKEYVDTKVTELSAEVSKKQDTITDLETIRSGAEKGATALQSVPSTYATKTDVATAIQTAITNELNADF